MSTRAKFIILLFLFFPLVALSQGKKNVTKKKKVKYRKVQNLNFDGEDVNGVARNPMSSYLVQNKSMKFLPLYKVKKTINKNLVKSLEGLR